MNSRRPLVAALVGATSLCLIHATGDVLAQDKDKPVVQIPQPGVPQIMTMEGKFVRAA
jgi:hypothetical protein